MPADKRFDIVYVGEECFLYLGILIAVGEDGQLSFSSTSLFVPILGIPNVLLLIPIEIANIRTKAIPQAPAISKIDWSSIPLNPTEKRPMSLP